MGYSPWSRKESDAAEHAHRHTHILSHFAVDMKRCISTALQF